jgi:hypothetical protein
MTIREAVDVAEMLGFRHVRVDAMCILQNDPADWLFESKNMAAIYAEVQLNIAASGSPHKEAGLLNKRSIPQHHLSDRCLQLDSAVHGEPSTLYFWREALDVEDRNSGGFEQTYPDAFRHQIERGLLADRAWVCEERIVSSRTLHYGEGQLFWQCNHTTATEDNLGTRFANYEDDTPWRSVFLSGGAGHSVTAYDDDGNPSGIDELRRLWYSFIIPKHYSRRKLTDQRDKSVAIAGLANKVKSHWESMRYLAGLWSGLELEGLLWSDRGSGQRFDVGIEYLAPSWSWASRDGGTEYGEFCAANALFDCRLLECQVETEDGGEFSRVSSATIKIEAAYLCGEAVSGQENPYLEHSTLRLDNGTITGRAVLDDDHVHHKEVSALLLRMDSVDTVFLLVIDHPERLGEQVRVGIGSVRSYKFPKSFDRLERSDWVLG